jgi:hypothetical protein
MGPVSMTRLLLIGASGLDWASLAAGLRSGGLPSLAELARRGAAGWLGAVPPRDGPAPWTSLATGCPPETHGVYRAEEAWSGGLRPISRASWSAPALWARLEAAGVSTGGVGWPAARPGAGWAGLHLDEDFAAASGRTGQDWALPRRCVPDAVRDTVRDLRVHPTDISPAMLKPLVPDMAGIEQVRDAGLPRLAVAMARAASLHAAAVWLLREPRPDAVFVHQLWLGEVRSCFERAPEGPYARVVQGAWRFLDGLVGRLAELAGPEALVILASPGWRSSPGVLLAAGPGVDGAGFEGADLLDLAPTVLARFGLQSELPGRAIGALAPDGPREAAPSPEPEPPVEPDAALLRTAADAGFNPPPPVPPAWRAQGLAELSLMLLPRTPAAAGRVALAASRQDPANLMALCVRALSHIALEEPGPLPELGEALRQGAPERGWGALAQGAFHVLRGEPQQAAPWLTKAEIEPEPDTLIAVAAAWIAASRPADAERVFKSILARDPANASAEIGLAITSSARRDYVSAEEALQRALRSDPGPPAAYLQLAQLYVPTGRPGLAERAAASAQRLGAAPEHVQAARKGALGG